jgi:hypothetical protein
MFRQILGVRRTTVTPRFAVWQWFLFSLIGFTIIDFLWLLRWG